MTSSCLTLEVKPENISGSSSYTSPLTRESSLRSADQKESHFSQNRNISNSISVIISSSGTSSFFLTLSFTGIRMLFLRPSFPESFFFYFYFYLTSCNISFLPLSPNITTVLGDLFYLFLLCLPHFFISLYHEAKRSALITSLDKRRICIPTTGTVTSSYFLPTTDARRRSHSNKDILSLSTVETGNMMVLLKVFPCIPFFSSFIFRDRKISTDTTLMTSTSKSSLSQVSSCKVLLPSDDDVGCIKSRILLDHEISTTYSSSLSHRETSGKSIFIHSCCRTSLAEDSFLAILLGHLSSSWKSVWKYSYCLASSSCMFLLIICRHNSQHFSCYTKRQSEGRVTSQGNSVVVTSKFPGRSSLMRMLFLITCCSTCLVSSCQAKDLIIRERTSGDQELLAFLIGFILFLSILALASAVSRCVWARDQRNHRSAQRLLTHHGDPSLYPSPSSSKSKSFLSSLLPGDHDDDDCDTDDDDDDYDGNDCYGQEADERQPLSSSVQFFRQKHYRRHQLLPCYPSSRNIPRSAVASSSSTGALFSPKTTPGTAYSSSYFSESSIDNDHCQGRRNDNNSKDVNDVSPFYSSSSHQLQRQQLLPDINEDTCFDKNSFSSSTSCTRELSHEEKKRRRKENEGVEEENARKSSSLPASFTYQDKMRGMRLMTNFDDLYDASEEDAMEGIKGCRREDLVRFKRLCVRIKNHNKKNKKQQNLSFL